MNTWFYLYLSVCSICMILIFLTALITVFIVLAQKSNSEGIQGITSSSETFFGKHKGNSMEAKLKKWTWVCLAVIALLSIVVFVLQIIAATYIN